MSLVLVGRVVPLSRDGHVAAKESASFQGRVWIGDDGRIEAVTRGSKKGPAGFNGAPTVDVGSNLIVPGLIDLHSHLAYATLPLWTEPIRTLGGVAENRMILIADVAGRIVRRLRCEAMGPSGECRVYWDGKTEDGNHAAPGVYWARVLGASNARVRLVLLR
jgi:hypothetical protein